MIQAVFPRSTGFMPFGAAASTVLCASRPTARALKSVEANSKGTKANN